MTININTRDHKTVSSCASLDKDTHKASAADVEKFDKAMEDDQTENMALSDKQSENKALSDKQSENKALSADKDARESALKDSLQHTDRKKLGSDNTKLPEQNLQSFITTNQTQNNIDTIKRGAYASAQAQSEFASLLAESADESHLKSSVTELSDIFSSLLGGQSSGSTHNASATVQAPSDLGSTTDVEKLNELASSIVERILVSDPKFSASSQIMLTLSNNSAFANMDIMLERTTDGTLVVEIYTKSREQTKDIVRIRQNITDALEKHENGLVRLTINEEDGFADSDKRHYHNQGF